MRIRARRLLALCLLALLTPAGCKDGTSPDARPAGIVVVSGDGQSGVVARALTQPLVVRVVDRRGRGVEGQQVTWSVVSGGGSLQQNAARSGPDGLLSAVWTLGTGAGAQQASASIAAGQGVSFQATGQPDAPATIQLTPSSLTFAALADTARLTAQVADRHGNPTPLVAVTWSSSNTGVADFAGGGVVRAVGPGSATITAQAGTARADVAVQVTQQPARVNLTPAQGTIDAVGGTIQLTATVLDRGGAVIPGQTLAWLSLDPGVAGVSGTGVVTATAAGTARIIVSTAGVADTAAIAVTQLPVSLAITPASLSFEALQQTRPLAAVVSDRLGHPISGVAVEWTSSAPAVATVTSSGQVTSLALGTATITARAGTLAAQVPVTVTQTAARMTLSPEALAFGTLGRTAELTADVRDASGLLIATPAITWSSSDVNVAAVDAAGTVTAIGNGTALIRARTGSIDAFVAVDVRQVVHSVTVSPATVQLGALGLTRALTALVTDSAGTRIDDAGVTWLSSNPGAVSVNAQGVVTAMSNGVAAVTARSAAVTGTATITVAQVPTLATTVAGDGGTAPVAGLRTVTVRVTDAAGHPVAGAAVAWHVLAGGGSLASATSPTDALGAASNAWTLGTTTGQQRVSATVTGLPPAIFTVLATAGPASLATSTLTSAASSLTANGTATTLVTVRLRDAYGNAVLAGGTLALSTTAGTLTGTGAPGTTVTPVDQADGSFTATLTAPLALGTATLSATVNGNPLTSTAAVNFVAGAAAKYLVTSSTLAAIAGSPLTLTAQLVDAHDNPVAAARTVTWSRTGAGGAFASATSATDATGRATVVFTTSTTAGIDYVFTAADGSGLNGSTATVRTVAGPPVRYQVTPATIAPVVGAAVAVSARLLDAHDNPVPGANRSVSWSKSHGSGSFSAATSLTDAGGAATVVLTTSTSAGVTYRVTADDGTISGTSADVTTVVGPPAELAIGAGNGLSASAGTATAAPPSVVVRDQFGNPVAGVTVTFTLTSGGGSLAGGSPQTAVTDATGVATAGAWTLGSTAGAAQQVVASAAGVPDAIFTATATPGAPASLQLTVQPSAAAQAGTVLGVQPVLQLIDGHGNPVAQPGVMVTASLSGAATLSGTTSVATDAAGTAAFSDLFIAGPAGSYQLTFTPPGPITPVTSGAIVLAAGAASQLVLLTPPTDAIAGAPITPAIQVAVRDAFGNTVTDATNEITLALAANPAGGTLAGTLVKNAAAGLASFADVSIATAGTGYTLRATAPGLAGVTSGSFAITPAPPAATVIVAGSGLTATVGTATAAAPTLRVLDAFANPLAGVTVTFAVTLGGGSLAGGSPQSVVTDATGLATADAWTMGTSSAVAGQVVASVPGLPDVVFTATAVADAAAALEFVAQPSAAAQAGAVLAQQPVLRLVDQYGNPVASGGVSVTAAVGSGTLGGTGTVASDAAGVVRFTDLSIAGLAGSYQLTFTPPAPLAAVTSDAIALTAGPASQMVWLTEPADAIARAPITPAIRVAVQDAYGNNVASATDAITLAIGSNPSGGTLAGLLSVTPAAGVASFSDISVDRIGAGYTLQATTAGLPAISSAGFDITHGPLDHFVVEAQAGGDIADQLAGTPVQVRITARDAMDNTVASFTGTVEITTEPAGGVTAGGASGAFTAGVLTSHAVTLSAGSYQLRVTRPGGAETGLSNSFIVESPPTALNDGPTATSAPGEPFHTGFNQPFTLAAPGVLSNDILGFPAATVASFGGGALGATVTLAGGTATPSAGTGSVRVNADGSIEFTPPTGFTGNFTFNYRLTNSRGSSDASVTIAVGARPAAVADDYTAARGNLLGNVPINTSNGTPFSVLANDAGDGLVPAVVMATSGAATIAADGTFTFEPAPGYEGPASITYTLTNGFGTTAPATVSLNVSGMVWFVDRTAAAGGTGSFSAPFNAVAPLAAVNNGLGNNPAGNDRIFIYSGSYTDPLTLLNGQHLVGQGAVAASAADALSVTWPVQGPAQPAVNGSAPVLAATAATAVTLASAGGENTLRGVSFGNATGGTALAGSNFGTLHVANVSIETDGRALSLTNGTLDGSFGRVHSTGGANNVRLENVATIGTSMLGAAMDALSGASGAALEIVGGNGSFSYSGAISNIATHAVRITGRSGGVVLLSGSINPGAPGRGIEATGNTATTVVFSGPAKRISNGASAGVNLVSNSGSTFQFPGGGLDITTTTGNAFMASAGGTVEVAGANNTLRSTGGIALSVNNVTIGAGGLTFRSISASGGANGILLNNTGALAGLNVTGDGATSGSGGTIVNTTGVDGATAGNGIYLGNTRLVQLNLMNVQATANSGVYGTGVRGLSLNRMRFTGNLGSSNSGTYNESAVHLVDVGGAVRVTGSRLDGGAMNALLVSNRLGTAPTLDSLVIANDTVSTMQGSTADVRGTALLVDLMDGTADVRIRDNQVNYWWGNAIHVLVQGTASGTARITDNIAHQTSGALAAAGGIGVGGGNLTYNIRGNSIRGTNGAAISADRASSGALMQGTIENNLIGQSGVNNSGSATGPGIFASHHGPGTTTTRIRNNTIRQVSGQAAGVIWLLSGDAVGFGGSGTNNVTVAANNLAETGAPAIASHMGILVTHGTQSGPPTDTDQGCYDIASNSITNINTGFGFAATSENRIRVNQRFGTTSRWPGYTGDALGATSSTGLAAYLLGRNTASNSTNANSSTGGFLNTSPAASACPLPAL